jgi:hypothetical protein
MTKQTFVRKIELAKLVRSRLHMVECMVEIEIDVDSIAYGLGGKAIRNRSGRSKGLSGIVIVKARPTNAGKATILKLEGEADARAQKPAT